MDNVTQFPQQNLNQGEEDKNMLLNIRAELIRAKQEIEAFANDEYLKDFPCIRKPVIGADGKPMLGPGGQEPMMMWVTPAQAMVEIEAAWERNTRDLRANSAGIILTV